MINPRTSETEKITLKISRLKSEIPRKTNPALNNYEGDGVNGV